MSAAADGEVRGWLAQGTAALLHEVDVAVARGTDPRIEHLPGWRVTHLLAHLAYNAEALGRLLTWAQTGVETPMYAGPEARDAEIEQGAARSIEENADHVRRSAARLDDEITAMPPAAWSAQVRTAQGRIVPASDVRWMRTREVWIHAIDLSVDGALGFLDMPRGLLQALITDVLAMFSRRDQMAGLTVVTTDAGTVARVDGGAERPVTVRGALPDLAAWLTGRGDGTGLRVDDGDALPPLPAWL